MPYSSKYRPRLVLEKEALDTLFEIGTWAILLFCFSYIGMIYGDLPDTIPSHMNAKGEIDGYSDKSFIWIFLGIGLVTALAMQWIQSIPYSFNYIVEITEKNARNQYEIGVQMIRFINFAMALLWMSIMLIMTGMVKIEWYTPPSWMIWVIVAFMLGGMAFYIKHSYNYK